MRVGFLDYGATVAFVTRCIRHRIHHRKVLGREGRPRIATYNRGFIPVVVRGSWSVVRPVGIVCGNRWSCARSASHDVRRTVGVHPMRSIRGVALVILALCAASAVTAGAGENWPQWRGAEGQGISTETKVPTEWAPGKN